MTPKLFVCTNLYLVYFRVHSNYILATTYRPQFPFTSSFICAAKLGPGFLTSLTEQISVYRLHAIAFIKAKCAVNLTSGSSQGVVSRDMVEDIMESPTLPRGEGGSH